MQAFSERDLSVVIRERQHLLTQDVTNADRNYLLNVNETQFVDYLVNKWSLPLLEIHFEAVTASDGEREIPVDSHPKKSLFSHNESQAFRRHFVCYHIPFSGSTELLNCRPSQWLMWSVDVTINGLNLDFEIIDWHNNPEEVKALFDKAVTNLKIQLKHLRTDVDKFNHELSSVTKSAFDARKKQLLAQMNTMAALGVPVRQVGGVPTTFVVPVVPNKPIVKPSAPSQAFVAEPTLDIATYDNILKLIHDFGVEMERHPSIYDGKGEETLRDHFLMILSPHFHSTTGETFNKSGKTDILIRHEGKNVFVAECKFWRGIKSFHSTIDQLLGYLTWRDSKAAVICFVDNKELNPVLDQIVAETPKHSCFIKDFGKKGDGQFQYEFYLKNDPSRSVSLAVLCFHFFKKRLMQNERE